MKIETYFVDTDRFLQFLTNDIPTRADLVETLLKRAASGEVYLVTTSMVIAEIVWTLESYYQTPKTNIQDKVLAILNTPGPEVENADQLLQAVVWYAEKNTDFIDAFNAAWMLKHDIENAITFDQKHFNHFEGISVKVPE